MSVGTRGTVGFTHIEVLDREVVAFGDDIGTSSDRICGDIDGGCIVEADIIHVDECEGAVTDRIEQ